MGPSNCKLDFRHQLTSSNTVCDENGHALVDISRVVPSGIIVFLPSYTYKAHSVHWWMETGLLLQRLQHRVEGEPKNSQEVELALDAYSRDAKSNGAFLLSVIGGKTSDGINFANEMAP
jgi:chromosome transmission fidelity protein 1